MTPLSAISNLANLAHNARFITMIFTPHLPETLDRSTLTILTRMSIMARLPSPLTNGKFIMLPTTMALVFPRINGSAPLQKRIQNETNSARNPSTSSWKPRPGIPTLVPLGKPTFTISPVPASTMLLLMTSFKHTYTSFKRMILLLRFQNRPPTTHWVILPMIVL
jgi:hypothetical protein